MPRNNMVQMVNSRSLYHMPRFIFGTVVIGLAGAVTHFAGMGIANVAQTAAGNYRITLADRYRGLLGFRCKIQPVADNIDATPQMAGEAVNTAGGGTLDFRTKTGAVSTNLGVGTEIRFRIALMDNSGDVVI